MELPVSPGAKSFHFNDTAGESVLASQCGESVLWVSAAPGSHCTENKPGVPGRYQPVTAPSPWGATVLWRCHPTPPPHPANNPSDFPHIFTATRLLSVRECRSPSHQHAGVWPQLQMCDSLRRGKHNKADLWLSFIWGSHERSQRGGLRGQDGWVLICLVNFLSSRPDFLGGKKKKKVTHVVLRIWENVTLHKQISSQ